MVYALILLAGKGQRFCNKQTKNLSIINKKHVFNFVADTCLKNKQIDKIVLIVNKNEKTIIQKTYKTNKKISVVMGSTISRQHSLNIGIKHISNNLKHNDIIVTLDGDRVFVTNELINKSIEVAKKQGYASAYIKLADSIIRINSDIKHIPRDSIYCVQTPQSFQFRYWNNKQIQGNDLFSSLNLKLSKKNLFNGSPLNFKITFKQDLAFAKKINNQL